MVHGAEDRRVANPLADPQLNANPRVQEEHSCQGEQEKSHHDEGGVRLPVSERAPALLAAHVVVIIQEVVLHLGDGGRKAVSDGAMIRTDKAGLTDGSVYMRQISGGFLSNVNLCFLYIFFPYSVFAQL